MGMLSLLFSNPVAKILQERLWESARKRYLEEHKDPVKDAKILWQKVREEYKDWVAERLKEGDEKVKAKWGQFKHAMIAQLRLALTKLFTLSKLALYSVESGQLPYPNAIAAPYELLKRVTIEVMAILLKQKIDFENLSDEELQALAIYAADRRFHEVLDDARRSNEPFSIGSDRFAIAEIIRRDAYFLGNDEHHSQIDIVILSRVMETADASKNTAKAAVRRWFDQERKNRKDDRRFTGAGWDIGPEELKSWSTEP